MRSEEGLSDNGEILIKGIVSLYCQFFLRDRGELYPRTKETKKERVGVRWNIHRPNLYKISQSLIPVFRLPNSLCEFDNMHTHIGKLFST